MYWQQLLCLEVVVICVLLLLFNQKLDVSQAARPSNRCTLQPLDVRKGRSIHAHVPWTLVSLCLCLPICVLNLRPSFPCLSCSPSVYAVHQNRRPVLVWHTTVPWLMTVLDINTQVSIRGCAYMYTHIMLKMLKYMCIQHVRICIYVYMYMYIYYIHAHAHTNIHTYTRACSSDLHGVVRSGVSASSSLDVDKWLWPFAMRTWLVWALTSFTLVKPWTLWQNQEWRLLAADSPVQWQYSVLCAYRWQQLILVEPSCAAEVGFVVGAPPGARIIGSPGSCVL